MGIETKDMIWMPHAGHFICGSRCAFKLNTYVNGVIVSTVGEYHPSFSREGKQMRLSGGGEVLARRDREPPEEIGFGRLYETMVFKAIPSKSVCCPFEIESGDNIDFAGYNTADDATRGHAAMLAKWSEGTTEKFERRAEAFRKATGMLRPGKDEAAGAGSPYTLEDRETAWVEWAKENPE